MAGIMIWRRRAFATIWRRRALAAVAVAITALGLAACGGDKPAGPGSGTETPGDSQLGGAPSGSSTPDAAETGQPPANPTTAGGGGGGNTAPLYPKDAKGYAQELLKAMAKPDFTRIGQLANQAGAQQIKDSVNGVGGNPNSQWPYLNCVVQDSTYHACVARNSHGDEMKIKLTTAKLGAPTAVTEANLDRTTYPNSPVEYARSLLMAHSQGNLQRTLRLSSETVKSMLSCTFGNTSTVTMIDATTSKVVLVGEGTSLGKRYEFKVLTAPGGKANAVKEVLAKNC